MVSVYQELGKEGEGRGEGGGEKGETMNTLPLTSRGSHCTFHVYTSGLTFGAQWFYEVTFTPQPL